MEKYRLDPCGRGCKSCGAGEHWDIIAPDGIALSTSWGDKEFAEELVEMLNDAYEMGRAVTHAGRDPQSQEPEYHVHP